jgi:hypothetical protein
MRHRLTCPHCQQRFTYQENLSTILGLLAFGLALLAPALWLSP